MEFRGGLETYLASGQSLWFLLLYTVRYIVPLEHFELLDGGKRADEGRWRTRDATWLSMPFVLLPHLRPRLLTRNKRSRQIIKHQK